MRLEKKYLQYAQHRHWLVEFLRYDSYMPTLAIDCVQLYRSEQNQIYIWKYSLFTKIALLIQFNTTSTKKCMPSLTQRGGDAHAANVAIAAAAAAAGAVRNSHHKQLALLHLLVHIY